MDSIINEKRRLHETLLSFPPFYTYVVRDAGCKNMRNREGNRSAIGVSSSTRIAGSKNRGIQKQYHQ